jgi:hypothetical protein
MLPSPDERREKEERDRQQAVQQPFNNNDSYVAPSNNNNTNSSQGFGDKLSAFFNSGGKSRANDGEITFAGNASNNTVTNKGTLCYFIV